MGREDDRGNSTNRKCSKFCAILTAEAKDFADFFSTSSGPWKTLKEHYERKAATKAENIAIMKFK